MLAFYNNFITISFKELNWLKMRSIRSFVDLNSYSTSTVQVSRSPNNQRNHSPFFSENEELSFNSPGKTIRGLAKPRQNQAKEFLRQSYDVRTNEYFKKDLRVLNQEGQPTRGLRCTVNGNIDQLVSKRPFLTNYYSRTYGQKTAPTEKVVSPTGSSIQPHLQSSKVHQHLANCRSETRLFKYDEIESKLDKSIRIIDQIKKLHKERKQRKENFRNVDGLKSVDLKNKNQSKEKQFNKKDYFEYYTPKFDKAAYQDRFSQRTTNESQSRTPSKIERPLSPALNKSRINSYKEPIDTFYNSPTLSKNSKSAYEIDSPQFYSPKTEKKLHRSSFREPQGGFSIHDFQLGKSLGEGKFGNVFVATHKPTHSLFAIKKIPKEMIKSHFMIDQFLLEVKLQSFMSHQNVLAIYGICDDADHLYLILEYMEEGTLFRLLKTNKVLSEEDAAKYLKQVAAAVRYIHENGIAHRDIKPENIVMSNGICKLCDFGWATVCDQRRKTYCGTFDYAAPEILEGIEYDMSVDLWCLGVLAYELMVGKAPFYHISRKETMKRILNVDSFKITYPDNISKKAISFIESLIKKDPTERMSSDSLLNHPFLSDVNSEFF